MKKKIFAVLLVVVLLCGVLSGCANSSLYEYNSDRDLDRVVARVGDYTISKRDLLATYLSVGSSYMQNYNMTVEEVLEYILNQLVERQILVEYAVNNLPKVDASSIEGFKDLDTNNFFDSESHMFNLELYLTNKEINEARQSAIDTIDSNLDTLETSVKEDWGIEEEEEEDNNTSADDDDDFTAVKKWATLNKLETEDGDEPDDTELLAAPVLPDKSNKTRYEAWLQWQKYLDTQGKSLNDIYISALETAVLTKLQNKIQDDTDVPDSIVEMMYRNVMALNLESYNRSLDAFETGLSSSSDITLYVPDYVSKYGVDKYFYVKNLLIPFSSEQTALLTYAKNNYDQKKYEEFRAQLATEITCFERENGYETDKSYTYLEVYDMLVADLNAAATLEEKNIVFVDYLYRFGTDTGMFNNEYDYLITPEGRDTTYVEEFIDGARELGKTGTLGSYSELILTEYGFHVVYITKIVEPSTTYKLDDVYNVTYAWDEENGKIVAEYHTVRDIYLKNLGESYKSTAYSNSMAVHIQSQKDRVWDDGKNYVYIDTSVYADWVESANAAS